MAEEDEIKREEFIDPVNNNNLLYDPSATILNQYMRDTVLEGMDSEEQWQRNQEGNSPSGQLRVRFDKDYDRDSANINDQALAFFKDHSLDVALTVLWGISGPLKVVNPGTFRATTATLGVGRGLGGYVFTYAGKALPGVTSIYRKAATSAPFTAAANQLAKKGGKGLLRSPLNWINNNRKRALGFAVFPAALQSFRNNGLPWQDDDEVVGPVLSETEQQELDRKTKSFAGGPEDDLVEIDNFWSLADFDMFATMYDLNGSDLAFDPVNQQERMDTTEPYKINEMLGSKSFTKNGTAEFEWGRQRRKPQYYGELTLTPRGMFADTNNEFVDDLSEPFTGSQGQILGVMTAEFYDTQAAISRNRAYEAGYKAESIGELETINRNFLAPGEEMPEEGIGLTNVRRAEDFEYDINDAWANYQSLNDEDQRLYAEGLLSLGYMPDGSIGDEMNWMLEPDKITEKAYVEAALINVSADLQTKMKQQAGYGGAQANLMDSNQFRKEDIRGQEMRRGFIPQLGLEGGLFDNDKAQIANFDEFVKEHQLKAGVLRSVPTNMIAQQVDNWSWKNLGRAANAELQSLGLQIAENVVSNSIGSSDQPSDSELLTSVNRNLLGQIDEETRSEADDVAMTDANNLLTSWLINSGRTLGS